MSAILFSVFAIFNCITIAHSLMYIPMFDGIIMLMDRCTLYIIGYIIKFNRMGPILSWKHVKLPSFIIIMRRILEAVPGSRDRAVSENCSISSLSNDFVTSRVTCG